jgi:hypothetical protein
MIRVIGFKKLRSGNKKYEIIFEKNGKKYTRKFGASGMSDYTIHKDKDRRERYISRHKKDLRTGDPMKPGYLSMYILWNKPTVTTSLADYKKRLNTFNRTGKFPTAIKGSKKLSSFGVSSIIPRKGTIFENVPDDVFTEMMQKPRSASLIQKNVRKKIYGRQKIINMLKTSDYNIYTTSGLKITEAMVELLTKEDFLGKSFWWKLVLTGLNLLKEIYDDIEGPFPTRNDFQTDEEYENFERNEELLIQLVHRGTGMYFDDQEDPYWINRIIYSWNNEVDTNSFGKKQTRKSTETKIPDNVVNKALYTRIKSKIRKDVNKKKRRWGAYDSGRLVREYKSNGGKYSGKKGKTNLGRWYKEKWVDACAWPKRKSCGRKTKEKIAYCRPSKRVDSKTPKLVQDLTKAQIKSRCSKKKRSPMKRITKFGQTTEDEPIGNGWVIHCNFIPGIGPHATLRRKDISGPTRDTDHAFRYGIKYAGKGPEFWSSGVLATNLNPEYQKLLIDYYHEKCGGYNPRPLPPKSPAPSTGLGFLSMFGSHFSLNFYKIIMKSSNDIDKMSNVLREQLKLRCRKMQTNKCDKILSELYVNIFYAIKRLKKSKKEMQTEIQIDIEKEIVKVKNKYNISIDETFKIRDQDLTKVKALLYILQDEVLDYTMNVAYLSSYISAYI